MAGASGAYDPRLKLELMARHHRDPITSIFSGAPLGHTAATDNNFASSLSVSQLLRTGAMASLTTSASREGNNSALTLFQPAYLTSLGVELRQPLLRNRAIDPARAALRVTALDRDRSGAALERQVLQTVAQVC